LLDAMGARASDALAMVDVADVRRKVEALNEFLFTHEGFAGNAENYYDPRNSLLTHVIERRTGIPITLSVVYMEVARRVGIAVEGVGLPGHFIVRVKFYDDASPRGMLVDPFGGRSIDEDECQARLDMIYGGQATLDG
jgi:regulator of sirC expression with transglutaminase-like and TPR domain